jgi:hypothetical protein
VTSFAKDIKPLFRESDRAAMTWAFDLWNHQAVKDHAEVILERLAAGEMPCDAEWPAEDVETFRRWVREGAPA